MVTSKILRVMRGMKSFLLVFCIQCVGVARFWWPEAPCLYVSAFSGLWYPKAWGPRRPEWGRPVFCGSVPSVFERLSVFLQFRLATVASGLDRERRLQSENRFESLWLVRQRLAMCERRKRSAKLSHRNGSKRQVRTARHVRKDLRNMAPTLVHLRTLIERNSCAMAKPKLLFHPMCSDRLVVRRFVPILNPPVFFPFVPPLRFSSDLLRFLSGEKSNLFRFTQSLPICQKQLSKLG